MPGKPPLIIEDLYPRLAEVIGSRTPDFCNFFANHLVLGGVYNSTV
jgi:hypothetical protein